LNCIFHNNGYFGLLGLSASPQPQTAKNRIISILGCKRSNVILCPQDIKTMFFYSMTFMLCLIISELQKSKKMQKTASNNKVLPTAPSVW